MVHRLSFRFRPFHLIPTWFVLLILVVTIPISTFGQDKVLHRFGNTQNDGESPFAPVTLVKGTLYGTTQNGGGSQAAGTVYEVSRNSSGRWTGKVLLSFSYTPYAPGGYAPQGGLVADAAGNLYGTTWGGGIYDYGVVFKLAPDGKGGWTETTLHAFNGTDGNQAVASLIFDQAGNLYGTTLIGGSRFGGNGNVFRLSPNSDGTWTETVLFKFNGENGSHPMGALTFDAAGNLYGTTDVGGAHNYFGNVYKLTRGKHGKWTETVLHSFNGADGGYGIGNVVFDTAGNLYGTTFGGGGTACEFGCGVVFELSPNSNGAWTYTVLYRFSGGSDGADPYAGLTIDDTGNLYGTTGFGGNFSVCGDGCGVVFKLSSNKKGEWTYTVLNSFDDSDGAVPESNVILGPSGTLFGTTLGGGGGKLCGAGCGTVFKLSRNQPGSQGSYGTQ